MSIIVNYGDKTVTLKVTVTAPNTTVPSTPQPSTEKQTEKQTEKTTEAKETGESESKVTTERTVYSEEELNAMLDEWIADIENKCGFNDSSLTDLEKLTNLTKYMATNFPYNSHSHYFYCMKEYVDTDPFGEGHVWGCDCVGYAGMIVDSAVYSLGYSAEDAYTDQDGTGHMVAYVKIGDIRYKFDAGINPGVDGALNRRSTMGEYVLGIIERERLDDCRYTQDEIAALWDTPVVGPEIGSLIKYDFYHQHDIHCGANGQYFKKFVPDDEMNRSWSSPVVPDYTEEKRDKKIYSRVRNEYRLQFYTEYMQQ